MKRAPTPSQNAGISNSRNVSPMTSLPPDTSSRREMPSSAMASKSASAQVRNATMSSDDGREHSAP